MDTVPRVRMGSRFYDTQAGTMYRTHRSPWDHLNSNPSKMGTFMKKQNVKVIDIGPDPPGLFRKYIWGRSSKLYTILVLILSAITLFYSALL